MALGSTHVQPSPSLGPPPLSPSPSPPPCGMHDPEAVAVGRGDVLGVGDRVGLAVDARGDGDAERVGSAVGAVVRAAVGAVVRAAGLGEPSGGGLAVGARVSAPGLAATLGRAVGAGVASRGAGAVPEGRAVGLPTCSPGAPAPPQPDRAPSRPAVAASVPMDGRGDLMRTCTVARGVRFDAGVIWLGVAPRIRRSAQAAGARPRSRGAVRAAPARGSRAAG